MPHANADALQESSGRVNIYGLIACEAVLDQCRAAGRFVYLATLPGKNGFGAPLEPWSMNAMMGGGAVRRGHRGETLSRARGHGGHTNMMATRP